VCVAVWVQREAAARDAGTPWSAIVALALVAASPAVAYWTLAGLEPPLVAALVVAALVATRAAAATTRRLPAICAACAWLALVLARVDGFVLAAAAAAVYGVHALRARRLHDFVRVWLPVALGGTAYAVWRVATYGDLIPNAVRAKFTGTGLHPGAGFAYLGGAVVAHPWLLLVPLAAWRLGRAPGASRPGVEAATAIVGAQCAIAVAAGGDWMPLHRLIVPVLPAAAALVAAAFARRAPAALVAAALVAPVAYWTGGGPFAVLLHRENVEVGTALGRALGAERERLSAGGDTDAGDPVLAIAAAGAAPFHSALPTIDLSGLCDAHIARVVPPGRVPGLPVGHEKGDGGDVMRRRPDFVAFVLGRNERPGVDAAEVQILFEPAFHAEYAAWEFAASRAPGRRLLWRATATQVRQLEFLAGLRPVTGTTPPRLVLEAPARLRFVVFRRVAPSPESSSDPLRAACAAVDAALRAGDWAQARRLLGAPATVAAFDAAGLASVREMIAARCAAATGDARAASTHLQRASAGAGALAAHVRLAALVDPLLRPLVVVP
jgi:hypothetical protein